MIVCGRIPRSLRVAGKAVVTEICVDGIRRRHEIFLVARIASRIGNIVVPGCVTTLAYYRAMCAGDCKVRGTVIKRRWLPC